MVLELQKRGVLWSAPKYFWLFRGSTLRMRRDLTLATHAALLMMFFLPQLPRDTVAASMSVIRTEKEDTLRLPGETTVKVKMRQKEGTTSC